MNAEPFDGAPDTLSRLVADWPFKPYRWARVSVDRLHALSHDRVRHSLTRRGVRAWLLRQGADPIGLAILEPLQWDTALLGMPAARADFIVAGDYQVRKAALGTLIDKVVDECRAAALAHLSVRVDAADDAAIHALESAGFLSVDALLTFERAVDIDQRSDVPPHLTLRDARPEDVGAIETVAASSFVDGRFHTDPSIGAETAASVYREWAASCCRGTAADGVVVAATGDEIAGFVACRIHPETGLHLARLTGSIVLIATAPGARRRGVGKAIMGAALDWCARHSAVAVQVGTQIRNTTAARLYEQCGFRLVTGSQSFRALISR